MATLRVTSTDRTFYEVPNDLAAILIEAFPASFEYGNRPKPAPAAPAPLWGIGKDAGDFPHIFYKHGGQVERYGGPPDKAVNGFKVRVWSGEKQAHVFEGPEPPPEIVEAYRQKYAAAGAPPAALPATYYAMARQEPEILK